MEGNEELVRQAGHFWWFGHTYDHYQPHKLSLQQLEQSMLSNLEFAKVHVCRCVLAYTCMYMCVFMYIPYPKKLRVSCFLACFLASILACFLASFLHSLITFLLVSFHSSLLSSFLSSLLSSTITCTYTRITHMYVHVRTCTYQSYRCPLSKKTPTCHMHRI